MEIAAPLRVKVQPSLLVTGVPKGRFVFILGGDDNASLQLGSAMQTFSQQLKGKKVPHVALTSASPLPTSWLPGTDGTLTPPSVCDGQGALWIHHCLNQATLVLVLVSPGYYRYADPYAEGAGQASTPGVQTLIRSLHKQLKEEFFGDASQPSRTVPVFHMQGGPAHIPSFLCESRSFTLPKQLKLLTAALKAVVLKGRVWSSG